jgi:cellulose biosynthesis protein BcsQ
MKTLATYSIKGGVGKTTTAVNVAYEAARSGARVLLWDLDPQGAATFCFRVKPLVKGGVERLVGDRRALATNVYATDHAGLHIVPADFSLRHLDLHLDDTKRPRRRLAALLDELADQYDVAILDCPPGITLTSESVFAAVDVLLVPTIPTTLSKRTLDQLSGFLAEFPTDQPGRPAVMPFASMVDRRKRLQRELVTELVEQTAGFLPTVIPNSSAVERMGVERSPIAVYAPSSPSALAFRHLWADVAARLWN